MKQSSSACQESMRANGKVHSGSMKSNMLNLKTTIIAIIIICLAQISPALRASLLTSDVARQAADVETLVSLASDPDPRNETSIAVSAVDDQIIVGTSKVFVGGGTASSGATRIAYYFSSDGGRSWGSALLGLATPQKTWSRSTRAAIASDLDGNFYLSAVMLDNASFDSGVYVFKSTDGGRTFTDPVAVTVDIGNSSNPKQAGKCHITVDTSQSSQLKNTVYVAYTLNDRTDSGSTRTVIQTARRRPGESVFSAPKTISHEGDMRGPSLATGPNGELYAAWEGIGNPKVILFNASTDGGETFLPRDVAPSIDLNIHNFVGSLSLPNPAISINGMQRINSFPVIGVDRSSGPNRGMIYVAWAETTNRIDSDIFIKQLTPPNGGRPEISSPVRVNTDAGNGDQFFPWLSVDQANGAVEVAFYDRRDNPGALMVNTYLARSTDGVRGFTKNTRVSAAGSDTRTQGTVPAENGSPIRFGDYLGLAAANSKAHMLWTDTRNGKQEVFYGKLDFDPSGGGGGGGEDTPANDSCLSARSIAAIPYLDVTDTRLATRSDDDPLSCSGNQDTHSVWYQITPAVDTVYGVDTLGSDYDTVVSVYTGDCGALAPLTCSDDFGNPQSVASRSLLTFSARAGQRYLIEASGKGRGGSLALRLGNPTITGIEYTDGPDGKSALKITGAGFVDGQAVVIVQKGGSDEALPTTFFGNDRQGDGTVTTLFGTKKKLKKLVKPGKTVLVRVESPAGSGRVSNQFSFTR